MLNTLPSLGVFEHLRHESVSVDARTAPPWENEVFVLNGCDRADLVRRAEELEQWIASRDVVLKDLAYTLNCVQPWDSHRLSLVAGTTEELSARLRRAIERLNDERCQQIKDSHGIYYFARPLHRQGKLALLFPGEGAQYLNMLADLLPHFPEIKQHFDRCDRISLAAGRQSDPISNSIFVSDVVSPQERLAADRNLWRLGNAVASILISEWALFLFLENLGVRADAFGGHSAGEFSALLAAGSLEPDDFFIEQLFALSHVLQKQEDDGQLAEAALVAVAAGRDKVAAAIAACDKSVTIAMDNCPHQTVAAGPPDAVAQVEQLLQSRGLACERLPFRRPYHTPLFEPLLGPIRQMYERVTIASWRTPVYSCTTGQLFPTEPTALRQLAVAHWASPVEFVRMAEAMYADGVRIFVEAGPRGNLTAFLEDIFRGRTAAAAAVNVARRGGISQISHMVAQLVAHHVPLKVEYLYRRRQPNEVCWQRPRLSDTHRFASTSTSAGTDEAAQHDDDALLPPRETALLQYLNVMEQFLETERIVFEQYLSGTRGTPSANGVNRSPNTDVMDFRTSLNGLEALLPPIDAEASASQARPQILAAAHTLPMIGQIIEHDPGVALVLRRRVELDEDRYARDHTLGGRHASALDANHHGQPVMPMAFSMEMMAEAARLLVSKPLFLGMRRVRLHRWIPLDEEPVLLEIRAKVLIDSPGHVAVEVYDLGNRVLPGNTEAPAVEGTIVFGDRYQDPPTVEPFELSNETVCRFSPAQLYDAERRMFHGPMFQAVCSTDRQGDEGIEGHLLALPHTHLFASTQSPQLLTDPLLIDASTHLLGCWHLSRPDQTGRVVFPYELGTVDVFGPRPSAGSRVLCRVRILKSSSRQVSHRIELFAPEGTLWCVLNPAEYWRFYWPSEYVDYFRHKERFLLAHPWPEVKQVWPEADRASASCMQLTAPEDLRQPVKRAAIARVSLCPKEWDEFRALPGPDQHKIEWLFGRIAQKDAVRQLWLGRRSQALFPADIEIFDSAQKCSVARLRSVAANDLEPFVCAAHSSGIFAALASFDCPVGIAMRSVSREDSTPCTALLEESEIALLVGLPGDQSEWVLRACCAKEAASKALFGHTDALGELKVSCVKSDNGQVEIHAPKTAAVARCRPIVQPLLAYTMRFQSTIVATTLVRGNNNDLQ